MTARLPLIRDDRRGYAPHGEKVQWEQCDKVPPWSTFDMIPMNNEGVPGYVKATVDGVESGDDMNTYMGVQFDGGAYMIRVHNYWYLHADDGTVLWSGDDDVDARWLAACIVAAQGGCPIHWADMGMKPNGRNGWTIKAGDRAIRTETTRRGRPLFSVKDEPTTMARAYPWAGHNFQSEITARLWCAERIQLAIEGNQP